MREDCLKLTIYAGERSRTAGRFLSDALMEVFAHHELNTSVVLRGAEGFGERRDMRSDRLLTLSEDLPLVSVAIDTPARIEAALRDVDRLRFGGLVTLERAKMITGSPESQPASAARGAQEATKLTVYLGRHERVGSRPAYQELVALLRARRAAGAMVLLGVDGTARAARRRASLLGRNAQVPLMVVSVAESDRIEALVPEIGALLEQPLLTLERVRICKRDGELLADPRLGAWGDAAGVPLWHKLMVYASSRSQHDRRPLSPQLLRALSSAGAPGATSVRGIWGYHGDHEPHGDTLLQLRRRVPMLTVAIDSPDRLASTFAVVDELTQETGLVTSELVPACQVRRAHQASPCALRIAELSDQPPGT